MYEKDQGKVKNIGLALSITHCNGSLGSATQQEGEDRRLKEWCKIPLLIVHTIMH